MEKKSGMETFETLGLRNMVQFVLTPMKCTEREWISVHIVKFYNELSLLWNILYPFCTPEQCPRMTCDGKTTYLWPLLSTHESVPVSAGKYVDLVFEMTEEKINNPTLFPPPSLSLSSAPSTFSTSTLTRREREHILKEKNELESTEHLSKQRSYRTDANGEESHMSTTSNIVDDKAFRSISHTILRRLHRVFAHIYFAHYRTIKKFNIHKHFNSSFKVLFFFSCALIWFIFNVFFLYINNSTSCIFADTLSLSWIVLQVYYKILRSY
ncbi:Mob1/phocein family protein [Reticulomyxa filosa]|uniref:Mob1/phocein family protein n=1 Tax=Reticulomyxa filosa TaxID=46433 RepID=X6NBK5_RETFI|nr:Mob1/phocein family protein [Reticulomyxa filosa]|eukprot:ETO23159.1 Mob1/phocein family protein [Reticulomyxa filosa]